MSGPGEDDGARLWKRVASTVTPPARRKALLMTQGATPSEPAPIPRAGAKAAAKPSAPTSRPAAKVLPTRPAATPETLEPRRQRRLSRERDPIEASIDLHGFGRFEAEDQLKAFLVSSQARGLRAVLVVTGQGRRGGGIIRASIHDWLTGPSLRGVVSGHAPAHRRHGGDGALYVTLKKR